MKRLFHLLIFVFFISAAIGQNNKVVSAYNYHKNGKLDKAKEAIDDATVHEKTMNDAKTWFYRGNIYIDIYRSTEYKDLDADALNKAWEAYKKAKELDDKDKYTSDINQFMPIVGESYFNDGANKFNQGMTAQDANDTTAAKQAFTGSMKSFEKAYEIYNEAGINDTTTVYYISVAAELAGKYDIAKEKLLTLKEMNYDKSSIYTSLANIYYKQDNDKDKALEVYAEGREKYPTDLNLLLNQTNLFLAEGMTDKALNNLEMAARIDTTNPTIFFAIGAKYNEVVDDTTKNEDMRKNAFNKAVNAYDKAIELDQNYFDPNYNMGALYVNRASALIDIANQLPLDQQDEYDAMIEEANDYLEKSIPYLEKAHELEPADRSTMISLKEIYTRLKMNDKLQEINAKLESN
ncbi:MAG: tetratricopeptide repeat protein [Bacteroidales bacterium]|nr:tetratricopeptide repeat protein [Bacteroidales bacterium]